MTSTAQIPLVGEWPSILQRYVTESGPLGPEMLPRRVRRRFHGEEVTLWQGFVHHDDVEGYVDNIRIKFYRNRWAARRKDPSGVPTTSDIYEIMLGADREEQKESRRPFHVERIAANIARNGVQEPIIVYSPGAGPAELWDGNRRFFGTRHIMRDPAYAESRDRVKWLPALVVTPTGDPSADQRLKHRVLTELNFVEKDHIPWPAFVKAEQIFQDFERLIAADPNDPLLKRRVKDRLAREYGLKGWRVADRWIKMYELSMMFKEYHEEEHSRDEATVDLRIQDEFEYFDEMSKPAVWAVLERDPESRDEVFQWLWDGKFKAFPDVRNVPRILADPLARSQANESDHDAVRRAIDTVIANDPTRVKDKSSAKLKIEQFAAWLDSFKREDYKQLDSSALGRLRDILGDVTQMLAGLQGDTAAPKQ